MDQPRDVDRPGPLKQSLLYVILIGGLVLTLVPFLWMLSTSLKRSEGISAVPPQWIPQPVTLEHYRRLFAEVAFLRHFGNSLVVALGATLLSLLVNALAGYAFAKYRFPGRERLFALLLLTMMVPGQVTMMPVFMLLKELGLLNAYSGLILPASASVFAIFLIKQFMETLPDELLEAARIDGCSEWAIFWRIVLPLSKPVLATVGLFTFMGAWNEFLWALIVMLDEAKYTLPVALANLNGQHNTDWGLLMAGSVVVILPVVIVFLLLQRFYVRGITLSGLKG
ncbi:MAG: carbohydrate ABC transporter permease [Deltaproteobacteria bacterium]|nr:carbohydrate ABC transporter permease [Deltaproteobacteria bacterium]